MKKTIGLLTIVLLCSVLFSGCKKDKDQPEPNYLKIGETTYDVSANINYCYPNAKVIVGIEMNFVGPNIDITEDQNGVPAWDGTDITAYFNIVSSEPAKIDAGTYTFSDSGEEFTFNYGDYCLSYTRNQTNTYVLLSEGTITVSVDGDIYDFTFEGKDETGENVKLHYQGEFIYYTPTPVK